MGSAGYSIPSASDLTKLYINGEFVDSQSGNHFTVHNPADDSVISERIPVANQADVDLAVEVAEKAFNGPWSTFTASQRSACLRKLADLLDEDDRLIKILTLDSLSTGNPVSIIPTREKTYIIGQILYYGEPHILIFFISGVKALMGSSWMD